MNPEDDDERNGFGKKEYKKRAVILRIQENTDQYNGKVIFQFCF